jgi:hypothetical protein
MPKATRNYYQPARRYLLMSSLPAIVAVLLSTSGVTIVSNAFAPSTDVVTNGRSHFCQRRFVDIIPSKEITITQSALCIGKSGNDENADLLEKARRLREEASLMEDDLRAATSSATTSLSTIADMPVVIVNKQLEDSVWALSYRFSSQPAPKESNDNNNNETPTPMTFYSGKLNILLKADGYSELIIAQENANANTNKETDIEIVKIWGWDRETSSEDDLDYLLFSMDVKFPKSDPDLSDQKERYYFQARVEQDTDKSIALKEGTITVKKDVSEKTGGMWGLFNVAGILTEFRYCGDFVGRASSR